MCCIAFYNILRQLHIEINAHVAVQTNRVACQEYSGLCYFVGLTQHNIVKSDTISIFTMGIKTIRDNNELTVILSGRLDTLTSPEFEERLEQELEGVERLVFDLSKLDYLSSAGLRVLVGAYRAKKNKGGILIRNPGKNVMDVFEITGLNRVFDFE